MKPIKDLFNNYVIPPKKRITERGELLKYFSEGLSFPIKRVAFILQGFTVKDLYYLQSICGQSKEFSKTFWGSIKTTKKSLRS